MCSYLHTLTLKIIHKAYIENESLWIKRQMNLKMHIDHVPSCKPSSIQFTKEGAWSLCISIKNYSTQETGKSIYNVLTLHGKQLLLKGDWPWSHKVLCMYFQKCLLGKDILSKLLSHSWKGLWNGINHYKAYNSYSYGSYVCIWKSEFS